MFNDKANIGGGHWGWDWGMRGQTHGALMSGESIHPKKQKTQAEMKELSEHSDLNCRLH